MKAAQLLIEKWEFAVSIGRPHFLQKDSLLWIGNKLSIRHTLQKVPRDLKQYCKKNQFTSWSVREAYAGKSYLNLR